MKTTFAIIIYGIFMHSMEIKAQKSIESIDLCGLVHDAANAGVDLKFKSPVIGWCEAVIYRTELLRDQLKIPIGEQKCFNESQIVVLGAEDVFSEDVRYAIELEKIVSRKRRMRVTYSIVEFDHNKRLNERKKIILTRKITLR